MGLSVDAFASSTSRGPRCGFSFVIDALPPDDLAVLDTVMADPLVTSIRIAEVLEAEGHRISSFTVNRHRRGRCSCGR